ncbi:DNA methyltransferase [Pseudoalteromonas pernae]|uniref:DNA methyltransferase n=1 Tax=Pseudoalteromonas pernae TaxID=3118054 RepID=UPI003241F5A5
MIRKAIYTAADEEKLIRQGEIWNFHEEKTQEFLHNLHPYPAKYIPQIPRKAIIDYSNVGDVVYDPFCGSGTTLLEASNLGRKAIGTDNNAVAVLLSKVKTKKYDDTDIANLQDFYERYTELMENSVERPGLVTDDKNFFYWYSPEVISHLSKLKGLIYSVDNGIQDLLLAVFSSILVKVSFQDSDTRYAKVDKEISIEKTDEQFLGKLKRVIKDLRDSNYVLNEEVCVSKCDARNIPHIESDSVNLIVTSPPYLNAYDYHKYHRQRLHWINADIKFTRTSEIGSHDQFTKKKAIPNPYFEDMEKCFREWHRVLKVGSKCVIVIGDAIVSKEPVRVADEFVEIMGSIGFKLDERVIRKLKPTSRSFNIRNSRMDFEHVLTFEK